MDITLLIMAAGIGSRFGGGIKQLAAVDDYGHIIMDSSIAVLEDGVVLLSDPIKAVIYKIQAY